MTHPAVFSAARAEPGDGAGWALERAAWQPVVFAERPRRFDLLRLEPRWPLRQARLVVHRNQPFELIVTPLKRFMAYAGFALELTVGPYDDSLQFATDDLAADAELIWLDFGRYDQLSEDVLSAWLRDRIKARREQCSAPILVADIAPAEDSEQRMNDRLRSCLDGLPGVNVIAISEIADELGSAFVDERARVITASTLSDDGAIEIARRLAFQWLPPCLEPRIKVVALDLDGTLYSGLLGEEGPSGLELGPAYRAVQEALVGFHSQGVLLAMVSRNQPDDVEALFRDRPDFPLRPDHFAFKSISWGAKADGLAAAAEALRIGTDAILFIDDNPGEIAAAAVAIPGLRCLLASNPDEVVRALRCYPGLAGYRVLTSDLLRAADLSAQDERARIAAQAPEPASYVRSLAVRLGFAMDPQHELARLSELSMKTNQFNTSLMRLSEAEVADRLTRDDYRTIAVALADRLSDAGTIAAIFTRREGRALVVDEIAISCRALGRGAEDALICAAVVRACRELGVDVARFVVKEGPRNEPARNWVSAITPELAPGATVPISDLAKRVAQMKDLITMTWT